MARYKNVKVVVPEVDSLGLDPGTVSELDAYCRAYRIIQDTPIDFRGVLPPAAAELFEEPATVKESQETIKRKLDSVIATVADQLPERLLGKSWDLRKVQRTTRKVNEDRLKMLLLQQGYQVVVDCPVQQAADDPAKPGNIIAIVCPYCHGTGRRLLTGLDAVNHLVREVVEESTSESWSVYKLAEPKGAQET